MKCERCGYDNRPGRAACQGGCGRSFRLTASGRFPVHSLVHYKRGHTALCPGSKQLAEEVLLEWDDVT